jgi:uncharacterized membrane protein (UPF0127 family)
MRVALIAVMLAGSLAGCEKKTALAPEVPAVRQPALPTKAQGQLPTLHLWLGPEDLTTEIAATPIQEETGMMFRTNLAENAGMIFLLGRPTHASFWMTNCPLPLSCAYIDPDGTIVELHDLQANDATPVQSASNNVAYVLEVNQGWFLRHHIVPGTLIRTEFGSLPATFSRRQ